MFIYQQGFRNPPTHCYVSVVVTVAINYHVIVVLIVAILCTEYSLEQCIIEFFDSEGFDVAFSV